MGRSKSKNKCKGCDLIYPLCICSVQSVIAGPTRVVILMHVRERTLTTNTARLAKLALGDRCEIRVRGLIGKGQPDCTDLKNPLVLFPSEDAEELSADFIKKNKIDLLNTTLVVPDGNWKQCAKVARRTPGIEKALRIKLPPGPPSDYRLRKEPRPDCVCTIEAIARALQVIEGAEVHDQMIRLFKMKVDRLLWARGDLLADKVFGGIPQAAFDSFEEAGRRGSLLQKLRQ